MVDHGSASLGKMQDLISKITREKRAGGVAQMGEQLSSKCETVSSNPSSDPPKSKNKQNSGRVRCPD
jgi:hypothetical protein